MRHPSALPTAQLWLQLFSFAAASLAAGLRSTVQVLDLWFQHGLVRGCPKLPPMVFACKLLFVHLSKSLTHMSHTIWLCWWSSPTISTFLTGEQKTTPGRWDLSHPPHRDLGNPECLLSPQYQGAEAWTMLGARGPSSTPPSSQAEQQRVVRGRPPGISRSLNPKRLEADPASPRKQQ